MAQALTLYGTPLGGKYPPYIIAELSGNHQQDKNKAKALILAAKNAGASAAKIQTYTADTLTLNARNKHFEIKNSGLWNGLNFHDLYSKGSLPWEWHKELSDYARQLGIDFFSSPFDATAVDFLEAQLNPEVYKVGSHELTNIPLLKKIAQTGKIVILSTGMGSELEIEDAINTLNRNGAKGIVLLKCISNYPAKPEDYNLRSMPYMQERFNCLVGLSDHSLGNEVCLGAVALGACVIEKHLMLEEDNEGSIDSGFSLTPEQFKDMVKSVKTLHCALGSKELRTHPQEKHELRSRRSIFVAENIMQGDVLTVDNLKIVRPADGLAPKHWEDILGRKASKDLEFGSPLALSDVQ